MRVEVRGLRLNPQGWRFRVSGLGWRVEGCGCEGHGYRVGVHVVLIRDRSVGARADNRILLVEGVRVRGALAHAVAGVGDMVQEGKNPKRHQGL